MENFFLNDIFFSELEDVYSELEIGESASELEDDFSIECYKSSHEKVFKLDEQSIFQWITEKEEHRLPDRDETPNLAEDIENKIKKAIKECFDIDKFNAMMPELYYSTNEFFIVTKEDLLELEGK